MKKILFISARDPFSGRFSGDVIRANKFINFLSKKYQVEIISLGEVNKNFKRKNLKHSIFTKENFILRELKILNQILNIKPLHFGMFYSSKMKKYINEVHKNYEIIFCQSIRSFQFVPKKITSKLILDMGDLYSKNYYQTYKNLSYFHPLKIIYLVESYLVRKYEKYCMSRADKTLLFSRKEIRQIKGVSKNKIFQINFGIDKVKKLFKYDLKNFKIIFIGNIKYTPNRKACSDFINNIFPIVKKKFPNLEFHIFGEIYSIDKYFFMNKNGVKIFGKVKNLEPYLSNVICGLANLRISTGIQTKLLTYMSYGIPCICSKKVYENFDKIQSIKLDYYENDKQFINHIFRLMQNKKYSNKISSKSLSVAKDFKWDKVLEIFNRVFIK